MQRPYVADHTLAAPPLPPLEPRRALVPADGRCLLDLAPSGPIGDLHNWVGWAIVIIAAAHAAAALFHHYVLRDDVLTRMLPRVNRFVLARR